MPDEDKQRLKEYQRNYRVFFLLLLLFFLMYKMRKDIVFKIKNNDYTKDKYCFQKDKKPINIKEVNIDKLVLSNKTPYGEQGANRYYIAYLNRGLRPLHIIIKDIKLYTNHMNILADDNMEIWNMD